MHRHIPSVLRLHLHLRRHAAQVLVSSIVLFSLPALACNTLFPPRPPVAWNTDPGSIILQASTGGGMLYDPNPMPFVRLRGDGQLIWVASDANGRQVLTAQLGPDQVRQVLQTVVNDGFFGWQDSYSPGVVYDAPETCLTVSLSSGSETVCEVVSGAPARFHELLDWLGTGAGASGSAFVPQRGYLKVTPLGATPAQGSPSIVAWPSQQLGLRLAEVGEGQWVEGDALQLAWNVMNKNPLNPVLQEGDTYYQLQLLVPGVTGFEPPN